MSVPFLPVTLDAGAAQSDARGDTHDSLLDGFGRGLTFDGGFRHDVQLPSMSFGYTVWIWTRTRVGEVSEKMGCVVCESQRLLRLGGTRMARAKIE
jgi:hypothetical protein